MVRNNVYLNLLILFALVMSIRAQDTSNNMSLADAAVEAANARQWLQNQNAGRSSDCAEDQCVNACKDGWEEHNGHCYYLSASNNTKNWTAAEDFCREQGSHLASMVDATLKDHILGEMAKNGHDSIWLGGNDIAEDTVWKWADCTSWNATFWAATEPNNVVNEDCVTLILDYPGDNNDWRYNKKWIDRICGHEQGFLCDKKICHGQNNGGTVLLKPAAITFAATLLIFFF